MLLFILLAFSWVNLVHVVRAEFLRARNFDYVRAARALGLSNRKIMVKHVLPNAMVATLTFLPFILNSSITTLTSLDFLGFGLPPGSPSLGELLLQGKSNLQAPWLGLSGFFVIAAHAVAAGLHRRSLARRLRSAKGFLMAPDAPLLDISGSLASVSGRPAASRWRSKTPRCGWSAGGRSAWSAKSGSGKSVTALSVVRLLAPGAKILGGAIFFQGRELLKASEAALRAMRGARIGMVFQEPMTSLNPLHRIEQPDRRSSRNPRAWPRATSAAPARSNCCKRSACKTPRKGSTPFRTSSRAASASA